MKKTAITSIFFLFVFVTSAQTDTLKTKGKKSIPTVIGKWQLDSISGSSKKSEQTIEFLDNGSYTQVNGNPAQTLDAITGLWKIENGAIVRDGRTNQIENLTIKKMVLSGMEGKKKVFYYYSRMDFKAQRLDPIVH